MINKDTICVRMHQRSCAVKTKPGWPSESVGLQKQGSDMHKISQRRNTNTKSVLHAYTYFLLRRGITLQESQQERLWWQHSGLQKWSWFYAYLFLLQGDKLVSASKALKECQFDRLYYLSFLLGSGVTLPASLQARQTLLMAQWFAETLRLPPYFLYSVNMLRWNRECVVVVVVVVVVFVVVVVVVVVVVAVVFNFVVVVVVYSKVGV